MKGRSKDEQIVRDIVSTEIDITNIKSILTLVRDRIDPADGEQILLPGGKYLDQKKLILMIREQSIPDVFHHLEQTPYRFISEIKNPGITRVKMSTYQSALDRYIITYGVKAFRGDPLSITITIGYLWEKINEITNLRIIARCKDAMITPEEMEAELIYV